MRNFGPMLTLALPTNGVMALMIGAMMIHDIIPGPEVSRPRQQEKAESERSIIVGRISLQLAHV